MAAKKKENEPDSSAFPLYPRVLAQDRIKKTQKCWWIRILVVHLMEFCREGTLCFLFFGLANHNRLASDRPLFWRMHYRFLATSKRSLDGLDGAKPSNGGMDVWMVFFRVLAFFLGFHYFFRDVSGLVVTSNWRCLGWLQTLRNGMVLTSQVKHGEL